MCQDSNITCIKRIILQLYGGIKEDMVKTKVKVKEDMVKNISEGQILTDCGDVMGADLKFVSPWFWARGIAAVISLIIIPGQKHDSRLAEDIPSCQ